MRYAIALLNLVFLISATAHAQTGVEGRWQTPNQSVVEIAHCGDEICAKLIGIGPTAPSHVDAKNPNQALRSRSLCGLGIGSRFRLVDATHAADGQLYDPESGHTYSGTMTADGDHLKLRGYIGVKLFGRTEIWIRLTANSPTPACK